MCLCCSFARLQIASIMEFACLCEGVDRVDNVELIVDRHVRNVPGGCELWVCGLALCPVQTRRSVAERASLALSLHSSLPSLCHLSSRPLIPPSLSALRPQSNNTAVYRPRAYIAFPFPGSSSPSGRDGSHNPVASNSAEHRSRLLASIPTATRPTRTSAAPTCCRSLLLSITWTFRTSCAPPRLPLLRALASPFLNDHQDILESRNSSQQIHILLALWYFYSGTFALKNSLAISYCRDAADSTKQRRAIRIGQCN